MNPCPVSLHNQQFVGAEHAARTETKILNELEKAKPSIAVAEMEADVQDLIAKKQMKVKPAPKDFAPDWRHDNDWGDSAPKNAPPQREPMFGDIPKA
jgi:hypothetical protein